MMEQPERKGMSKGCLVALIVVGALLLIVVIGALTCWFYRVDLARMGAVTMLNQIKQSVAENPPASVDTAQFNGLIDGYVERLDDPTVDQDTTLARIAEVMQTLQGLAGDETISDVDIRRLSEALIEQYPDLADRYQIEERTDSIPEIDSI